MTILVKQKNAGVIEEWSFAFLRDGDDGYLLLDQYRCGRAKSGRIRPPKWDTKYRRNGRTGISVDDVPLVQVSVVDKAKKELLRKLTGLAGSVTILR